jgi:transcriptional regulator with XRE-family HTH domain
MPFLATLRVQANHFRTKSAVLPAQVRAGRGLLGWSRAKLANESGVSLRALVDLEAGQTPRPRTRTLNALAATLIAHGVEFIQPNGGGPGVRLTREAALREAVAAARGE